jgi:NAD(P)-dependent dehydrogenase (short-subunit alcohol dehydrogenase family)
MRELEGRTAVVTGGASGIGLALGRALAQAGVNIMLADIEAPALEATVEELCASGYRVRGFACDVTDPASVEAVAAATRQEFGAVHIVCDNAGVAGGTGFEDLSLDTWRWVLDVNLMGVLHGIRAFLPQMRAHGQGGHFVNIASMAGLQAGLGFSPYVASKYAVVGLSEGLAVDLRPLGIGVSIVCPGFVRTRIGEASRNRQARYGPAPTLTPGGPADMLVAEIAGRLQAGLDPAMVAVQVLEAIREERLYVFTHPEMRDEVEARFDAIIAALNEAEARGASR